MNDTVKSGATLNRHRSKQDYETPWELIRAIEKRWGPIACDLAATPDNFKSRNGCFITPERDSLSVDWHHYTGLLFLNPPFGDIKPWAKKCSEESVRGARIAFLVPASVGSAWFADYVHGKALVCPLLPRVSFDGKNPFPKDCMVCVYGPTPGFEPWRWKT